MSNETISYLRNFIIFQSMFGINRSFLLKNVVYKFISFSMLLFSLSFTLVFIIYDELYTDDKRWYSYAIKTLAGFEVIYLSVSVRKTNIFFKVLKDLDDKHDFFDENKTIRNAANFSVAVSLVSLVIDVLGMKIMRLPNSVVIMGSLALCAIDSEFSLCALIAEIFNTRLATLIASNPTSGSVLYKQLLLGAISFSGAFHNQTLLLVFLTLLMSVIYAGTASVASGVGVEFLRIFFIWRELKSLFSLWLFCSSVERTRKLCEQLQFHLGERLVFDRLEGNADVIVKRWYLCVGSMQLQRMIGAAPVVTSRLPYKILDWTFNYLIIIVQIYMAYK